jgi:plasmid stabilization system protein ParE
MAIRVLPEARDDLRDAASYYRALPPPKVGRELAARIVQDFRHALVAVEDMPLSRQEHPEIPGVRWVHFGTLTAPGPTAARDAATWRGPAGGRARSAAGPCR